MPIAGLNSIAWCATAIGQALGGRLTALRRLEEHSSDFEETTDS